MVAVTAAGYFVAPDDPVLLQMQKVREEHARTQKKDYSHVFRPKSYFDLMRLSCIVVGIELAYAAETAFVSPILLQIGIEHKHMTMVWALSPLFGFFIAPVLGSLSDRCRLTLGRRRPIIILLSIGIFAGLLLVPYGREIGLLLGDIEASTATNSTVNGTVQMTNTVQGDYKFAIIITVIGVILLDFDADTCQTPARTYVLDVCLPSDHPKAMSAFTILAGLGGGIGYILGAIDWNMTNIGIFFGSNIKAVFGLVTIAFVLCFVVTITSFREIPLKLMEADELLRPISAVTVKREKAKQKNPIYVIREATLAQLNIVTEAMKNGNAKNKHVANGNAQNGHISNGKIENGTVQNNNLPVPPPLANGSLKDDISLSPSAESDAESEKITLSQYLKSIVVMPRSMAMVSFTNLLCWMSHVCYSLYFTDFVGEAVFHGDPQAAVGSAAYNLYNEGVRYGCWGLAIYSLSCSLYSTLVEKLIKWLSIKTCYISGIFIFAIGMIILAAWPTKIGVLVLSSTAGIIYATIFTMPYILVARYHAQDCFKVTKGENVPLKQSRGLGTDIAIISSMVFIAQFIVSLGAGSLITAMGSTSAVLYASGVFGICAALAAFKVLYI